MRVLVSGGRGYCDVGALYAALDDVHRATPITLLVHGGASGADALAAEWARAHRVTTHVFTADWKRHHASAGPIRNQAMVDAGADLCLAFAGGRGTADCVRRARKAGILVREVTP